MRRTNCVVVFLFFFVVLVKSLPIEIKDIEYLFPPQNTFFDDSQGEYLTKIDKQIDSSASSEEVPARKACGPKQESSPEENILNNDYPSSGGFNDTTPLNGTIVDDMDLQRALTALMRAATPSNTTQPPPLSTTSQFPFNDFISAALVASTNANKGGALSLGILPPYEHAAIPYTPTKKAAKYDSTTEPSSPVSSHSSTVSSTNFSSPQQSPHRKLACPIPAEKKDDAYFERRRKNNDAAKRSRDARRHKEEAIAARAATLEQENIQLRGQIAVLQQETAKLQLLLFTATTNINANANNTTNQTTPTNRVTTEIIKNESSIEI